MTNKIIINGVEHEIVEVGGRMIDLSKPPDGISLEDFVRQIVREELAAYQQMRNEKIHKAVLRYE